ncbi:MAG: hypothetical protein NXI32_05540, partial [bacterium]|nr:hypothetical protein [bacterium]
MNFQAGKDRRRQREIRRKLQRRRLNRVLTAEPLESRQLLAVSADLAGNAVNFLSTGEKVYLRTATSGLLEWSTDKSSWTTDLDSNTSGNQELDATAGNAVTISAAPFPVPGVGEDAGKLVLTDRTWVLGAGLSIQSTKLEVEAGAVVSTRKVANASDLLNGNSTGNSGNLIIASQQIVIGSGAQLLSQVENGSSFTAGKLELLSESNDAINLVPFVDIRDVSTSIMLTDATLKGGAVKLNADAQAADDFLDEDEPFNFYDSVLTGAANLLGSLPSLVGGAAIAKADARIDVNGGLIEGASINIDSYARTQADVTALTLLLAVAYGQSSPQAHVNVYGDAAIHSTGDTTVRTSADSILGVSAQQSLTGISTTSEKVNLTLAIGEADIDAVTKLGSNTSLNVGGNLLVESQIGKPVISFLMEPLNPGKEHAVSTSSLAYDDGTLAGAVSIFVDHTNAEARLDGTAVVTGNVDVHTQIDAFATGATAASGVGTSEGITEKIKGKLGRFASQKLYSNALGSLLSRIGVRGRHQTETTLNKQKFGLSAALSYADFNNTAVASIGDNADVRATGDVKVLATATDSPKASATSKVSSSKSFKVDEAGGLPKLEKDSVDSQRDYGASGAVTIGLYTNNVLAEIGSNAYVSGRDVIVESLMAAPYVVQYIWNWNFNNPQFTENLLDPSTYLGKLKGDLGIPSGFFTTYSASQSTAQKGTLSGSLSFIHYDNTSRALIDRNATVVAGRDVSVIASEENDSFNWAGPFLKNGNPTNFFKSTGTEGIGIGGSYGWFEYGNTTVAEIDAGANVTADSLLVFADTDSRNMTFGVNGGASDKLAVNGVMTGIVIANNTLARIDEDAFITTGDGTVTIPIDYDIVRDGDVSPLALKPEFDPLAVDINDNTAVDVDLNTISFNRDHDYETGDSVVYDDGGGVAIGGLIDGATYYVVKVDDSTIRLAASYADAVAATPVTLPLNLTLTEGQKHSFYQGFDPTASGVVDATNNRIDLGFAHELLPGQPVLYSTAGGSKINGLTPGTTYYAIPVFGAPSLIQLADSEDKARAAYWKPDTLATNSVDIDLAGTTGRGHSLLPIEFGQLSALDPSTTLDSNGDGRVTDQDKFIAGIDADLKNYLTTENLLVYARDESQIFNAAGGIAFGRNVGVGGVLAVDLIDRMTQALIGSEEFSLARSEFAPGVGVDSAGTINLGYSHGFQTGDAVVYTAGGDSHIAGLLDGQTYFVRRLSDTTLSLHRTLLAAQNDSSTRFDASTDVNGNLRTIDLGYVHGFQLGDRITYSVEAGQAIDGLVDGATYFVIPLTSTSLALTEDLDSASESFDTVFDPEEVVRGSELNFNYDHEFDADQLVYYTTGGGTSIGGLTNEGVYKVAIVDTTTISLKDLAGNPLTLDNSVAQGISHTLHPVMDASTQVIAPGDRDDATVEMLNLGYIHDLISEDLVRYDALGDSNIGGLTSGNSYYAVVFNGSRIGLAATEEDAFKARLKYFIPSDGTNGFASQSLFDDGNDGSIDTIELYVEHGYQDGDAVVYSAAGGTPIGGLTDGQTYYVINPDPDTTNLAGPESMIKLAATPTDATNGIAITLNASAVPTTDTYHYIRGDNLISLNPTLATAGKGHLIQPNFRMALESTPTGTQTLSLALEPLGAFEETHGIGRPWSASSVNSTENTIDLGYTHGFTTGQRILYEAGSGKPIGGLAEGQVYYAVVVNSTKIQLAESYEEAIKATPEIVELNPSVASGASHAIVSQLRPIPVVDGAANTFRILRHGLLDGESIKYINEGSNDIGGLVNGNSYSVIVVDSDTIQLANPVTPTTPINLDPSASISINQRLSQVGDSTGSVNVNGGSASVVSNNTGDIISVTVAASSTSKKRTGRKFSKSTNTHDNDAAKYGVAFSGNVTIGIITDQTLARLNYANVFTTAGDLNIKAFNDSSIGMGAGAFALSKSTSSPTGIAGALTVTVISNQTEALIVDSQVNVSGNVKLQSDATSAIVGVAMGGGIAKGGVGLAGSVVVNVIKNTTRALIESNSLVLASQDVQLTANETNRIIGVSGAGGISYGASSYPLDSNFAKKQRGIGAALAFNFIVSRIDKNDREVSGVAAFIRDSDVTAGQNISTDVDLSNAITSIAAGIGFAIGGQDVAAGAISLGVNYVGTKGRSGIARKRQNGVLAGSDVSVDADDQTHVVAVTGTAAVAFGEESAANGLAVGISVVNTGVRSVIKDASVTSTGGDVDLRATSIPTVTSIAAGAAISGEAARQGSFSVSILDANTQAFISGDSTVTADGNVVVQADDQVKIFSLGGSISLGGLTGLGDPTAVLQSLGIANSTLISANKVQAAIDDGATVQANGNRGTSQVFTGKINDDKSRVTENITGVSVAAVSLDSIVTIAAGVTISGVDSPSIAASNTLTIMNEETKAWIGKSASVNQASSGEATAQSVYVRSGERTNLDGIAGALAANWYNGSVGVGVDVAVVNNDIQSYIDSGANIEAQNNVVVNALSEQDLLSVAAAVAIAKETGLAGGVGVSVYNITTTAEVLGANAGLSLAGAKLSAGGSVVVNAENNFVIEVGNGSLGFGTDNGVAGAIGVPIITKTTEARIGSSATVDAFANRAGIAVNSGDFSTFGGANQSGEIGQADLDYTHLPTADDQSYFKDRNAAPGKLSGFKGVSVTAIAADSVELYGVGAAISPQNSLAVTVGFSHIDTTTVAAVEANANVNQNTSGSSSEQSVHVASGTDLFMRTVMGAVALGGSKVGSPAVDVIFVSLDTQAFIDKSANVSARDDIQVLALAEEDLIGVSVAIAGSLGGSFAGAGSAVAAKLNNTTYAFVDDGATLSAGNNVRVYAEDKTDADIISGGVGLALASGGGVGASINVGLIDKDTQAWIGAASVDALGGNSTFTTFTGEESNGNAATTNIRGVGVGAYALEDVFVLSVAGAGGTVTGVAGAVNWQTFNSDTTAEIRDGALINQGVDNNTLAHVDQDVYVVALNKVNSSGIAGALGLTAGLGIGAGLDVGALGNATVAMAAGDINARRDVRVAATSDREILSVAAAGSIGAVALTGGVSHWVISGDINGNYSVGGVTADALKAQNGTQSDTATASTLQTSTNVSPGYTAFGNNIRGDNTGEVANLANGVLSGLTDFSEFFTANHFAETRTEIGLNANVAAGRDVEVVAREDNDLDIAGGSVNFSFAGAGAGIGLLSLSSPVIARIGINAGVSAIGKVEVSALSDQSADAFGIAGSGNLIGGAAAFSRIRNNGLLSASVLDGASVTNAANVDVTAKHRADLYARAGSGGLGIGVAGVSGSLMDSSGTVEAFVEGTLGEFDNKVGNVNISATSDIDNDASEGQTSYAIGVAGGAIASVGVAATSTVAPVVNGAIGSGAAVYSSGAVNVVSEADVESNTVATNINGGALTVGASFANSTTAPAVTAEVGLGTVVEGASIDVLALNNFDRSGNPRNKQSRAKATSGTGAVITFLGAEATAEAKGNANAIIGSGADLKAITTDINVLALSSNKAYGEGDGNAFSFLGKGDANGVATLESLTGVSVADSVNMNAANNLTLRARTRDYADAWGDAGDRAAIQFSRGAGDMQVDNSTDIAVLSTSELVAENTLTIEAFADHFSNTRGSSDVGDFGLSLGSNIRTEANSVVNTAVDVDIDAAKLQANQVILRSRMNSLNATTDADSVAPYQFGADTDAYSELRTNTTTVLDLAGTEIIGVAGVQLISDHLQALTKSDGLADANALGGDTDVSAENFATIRSNIAADSSTVITTPSLKVAAELPVNGQLRLEENPRRIKALFDGGTVTTSDTTTDIQRDVLFNAKVNVASSGPVLEINQAGQVVTQTGGVTFTPGSTIVVDAITNTNPLQGNVVFAMPGQVGTRSLRGSSVVDLRKAFIQVKIDNDSPADLQINRIDVLNENGGVSITRPSDLTTDTLNIQQTVSQGSSIIDIENSKNIILAGDIEDSFGTTSITAESGNITRTSASHDIFTANLMLNAPAGNIGAGSESKNRIGVRAASDSQNTVLSVLASGNIYLQQAAGIAAVKEIASSGGNADLFSVGNIIDGSGENQAADIAGQKIILDSNGSVGFLADPLEINTGSTAGALSAAGDAGVYLTELSGGISVDQLHSENGNIVFSQIDAPGDVETFDVTASGHLSAANGSIILNLADDVTFAAGSQITAKSAIDVLVDRAIVADDVGVTVSFDASLIGDAIFNLTTGDDPDQVLIKQLTKAGSFHTGLGNDAIIVASDAMRLDAIAASLTLDAGGDADTLTLNASGASDVGVSGTFDDSPEPGYSTRVTDFEMSGTIDYTAFEEISL